MPDLGYVLGADFLAYYDVSEQWRTGLLQLGGDPGQRPTYCQSIILEHVSMGF